LGWVETLNGEKREEWNIGMMECRERKGVPRFAGFGKKGVRGDFGRIGLVYFGMI